MSNFLAIATVTETLRQIVDGAIREDVNGAAAKAVRPDAPDTELPNPGVNIYLYQVTPNAAWRNADLPTRRANGELSQRPSAAIDLHYLITFYGNESQLEPQRLLGSTLRTLHEQPVLAREKIRSVINAAVAADPQHFLRASNLDEAVELVKFTPLPINLEELSKLWSVFFQKAYALSVTYQGTVVLIESESRPQPALPVRDRNLYVNTFRQPRIEQVASTLGLNEPITASSTLLISGAQLRGVATTVRFGQIDVAPPASQVSDTQIKVILPAGLRAGVQSLQIVQPVLIGTPPLPHSGVESNVAPFVLHPLITATVSNGQSTVINGVTFRAADVTVTFTPNVATGQRLVLLLNEFQNAPSSNARAYRFAAPAWNTITLPPGVNETNSVVFPIENVIPGNYLVRVQVDGAESLLDQAADNRYNAPQVAI